MSKTSKQIVEIINDNEIYIIAAEEFRNEQYTSNRLRMMKLMIDLIQLIISLMQLMTIII